jgi:large subunit ribosomal protein L24
MNVKLNDNVVVITGKDVGKQGKVVATSPKSGKVTVEGVNLQKKAKKARRANEVSQIVEREGAIDVSNVMIICDSCGKAVRVKYSVVDGKKHRVCPKCGASLDKAYVAKNAKSKTEEAPKKRTRKRAAKKEESATPSEDAE